MPAYTDATLSVFISVNAVYGNVDISIHVSNSVSKTMFPAHVSELHRNRDEGFEREYEARVACMAVLHHGMHYIFYYIMYYECKR